MILLLTYSPLYIKSPFKNLHLHTRKCCYQHSVLIFVNEPFKSVERMIFTLCNTMLDLPRKLYMQILLSVGIIKQNFT